MRYKIAQFKCISGSDRRALAQYGIIDSSELLTLTATPEQRQILSKQTRVPLSKITQWAGIADLVRTNSISLAFAELLVSSGAVSNLQHLLDSKVRGGGRKAAAASSRRERSLERAISLANVLKEFKTAGLIKHRVPEIGRLSESIEDGHELKPRLAISNPAERVAFVERTSRLAKSELADHKKAHLALIVILFLSCVVLFAGSFIIHRHSLVNLNLGKDSIAELGLEVAKTTQSFQSISLGVATGLLIVSMILLLVIHEAYQYVLKSHLVTLMFATPDLQKLFIELKSKSQEREGFTIKLGLASLVIVFIGLITIGFSTFGHSATTQVLMDRLTPVIILGGGLIGLAISLPSLLFYREEFKLNAETTYDNLQRFFVYDLVGWMALPALMIILFQSVLPGAFWIHKQVTDSYIEPRAVTAMSEKRAEAASLQLSGEQEEKRRIELLATIDSLVSNHHVGLDLTVVSKGDELYSVGVPAASRAIAWVVIIGILTMFVLPYLVLGKWRKPLLYILIVAVGYVLDHVLEEFSPGLFSLEKGSVVAGLVTAFIVFASALFLDWIFQTVIEGKRSCPACRNKQKENAVYCDRCGFVQKD